MKWIKRLAILVIVMMLMGVAAVAAAYLYVKPDLPDVTTLKTVRLQTPLRIYSADGQLISQFGEKRRIPLQYEQIPQPLIDAVLATEDARFYEHGGVDPIGVLRAAVIVATTGKKSQGASTITMQVARNFFLSREKTYIRKIKEIFIAYHIEQLISKNEILELYLNRTFFGNRAYGIGAAAQVYYGKDISELNLAQYAMIAGLPQSPSAANPIRNPQRGKNRRNVVLGRMLELKLISEQEYQQAHDAPVTARYHGAEIDLYAPYISEMVRDQIVAQYGEEEAYTAGLSVYTSIDSRLQRYAQRALRNNLYDYDERHGYRGPRAQLWNEQAWPITQIQEYLNKQRREQDLVPAIVVDVQEQSAAVVIANGDEIQLQWDGLKWARGFVSDTRQGPAPKVASEIVTAGDLIWIRQKQDQWQLSQVPDATSAIVSLDPYNGAIKALVGGYSFNQSQYNRVTQAKRQLGSNIKPFIYAAGIEQDYTLASLINNAPINEWDRRQGVAWRPKNSPDVYGGPTRLRVGLARSINVMAVRALRHVGIDNAIDSLVRFGFERADMPRNESLALGSASATPLDVVNAYSVFANGGFLVEPYFIERIVNSEQQSVFEAKPKVACRDCERLIEEQRNQPAMAIAVTEPPQQDSLETALQPQDVQLTCPLPAERLAPRVMSEQHSFLLAQALKSTIWGGGNWSKGTGWNGTAWRAARTVKRRDIAGKTGTTNEARDTWFSGFNPKLVTTIWVGFDDHGRQLGRVAYNNNLDKNQSYGGEAGAKTAGPGWNEYMKNALDGTPEVNVQPPQNIISVRIDRETGLLTRATDHTSRFEYFIAGTEPTEYVSSAPDEQPLFEDSEDEELF
ncbi:penicillin-binding protein 1A [Paraferrimonas haliotis]|nr:PBP1A family penicillin-binding protein [Paraferrimonas haliotis]